jgi:hypothetical protein
MTVTGAKGIVPNETDQSICGKSEWRIVAACAGFHPEFRQRRLILKPCIDFVRSWRGTTAIEIENVNPDSYHCHQESKKDEFFNHDHDYTCLTFWR